MNIKYAGPRATISHHGIEFKDGKEDKYLYLMIGIQILVAIDKDYGENKSYSYDLNTQRLTNDEMITIMKKYEPNLDIEMEKESDDYSEHISDEVQKVKDNNTLSLIEKQVWISNLEVMREYRIQRANNKIYYMHCIKNIKNVVKRESIKCISAPFYEKYWHVLQTLQGMLEEGRDSIKTNLRVQSDENNQMMAKLYIGV
ncbi:MAG: hypothetical protein U9R39_05665 [Campylobacterota bacterium]|nr:hypothetical protein [Campylobacterota bacterium]